MSSFPIDWTISNLLPIDNFRETLAEDLLRPYRLYHIIIYNSNNSVRGPPQRSHNMVPLSSQCALLYRTDAILVEIMTIFNDLKNIQVISK